MIAARGAAEGTRTRPAARPRYAARYAGGVAVLAASIGLALAVGEPISWSRAIDDPQSLDRAILVGARLPRVALGVLAGAGLAVTGGAYQGLLRNALAEPYVLGVAGGAALGATIALTLGAGATLLGASATAIAAAVGGLLATALVYALATGAASRGGGFGIARGHSLGGHAAGVLLAGVIVNAIAGAAITFVKTVVRASTAQQLLFWLAGFLDVPTFAALAVVAVAVLGGTIVLILDAPRLNLLALGDEQAGHLGVDVASLERRVFLASSLVVGAIVATCGVIAFVGLLVPHVLRSLVGHDHRRLLPSSLVGGAVTLVLCDAGSRVCFRLVGTEPPVGAITALVGGPVFLALLGRAASRSHA